MRFVDLFAGLGGFHLALRSLGHNCVFACEIDDELRALYKINFPRLAKRYVKGDIRSINENDIPAHDILCAGFPCQPFSKAGTQEGEKCPRWGDLFEHVLRIVRLRQPDYVILENVPNLETHDDGRTWEEMKRRLEEIVPWGYEVDYLKLSPHEFGIPQVRQRLLIVASRYPLTDFRATFEHNVRRHRGTQPRLSEILDETAEDALPISKHRLACIETWQRFLDVLPREVQIPSVPIWSMEFGATYPFERTTPHALLESESWQDLWEFRGSHGKSLNGLSKDEIRKALPSHAVRADQVFPSWKINFIRQNREFYQANQAALAEWLPSILTFAPSLQKFEWNCLHDERNIWRYVLQFRASGLRVKRPTTAPSLIAMTTTQVPIIAWQRRHMTVSECARLQSMSRLKQLPTTPSSAYAALGNAVNVQVVRWVARALFEATATAREVGIGLINTPVLADPTPLMVPRQRVEQ